MTVSGRKWYDNAWIGWKGRDDETVCRNIVNQIRSEMRYPKSERVLRCQEALNMSGCPVERLEEATIECLLPQVLSSMRSGRINKSFMAFDNKG